jgi:hypothetical protein
MHHVKSNPNTKAINKINQMIKESKDKKHFYYLQKILISVQNGTLEFYWFYYYAYQLRIFINLL